MKHIYIVVLLLLGIGILSFKSLGFHRITLDKDTIEVTVVYKEEQKKLTVDNYSTIEEVLEQVDLGDDIDFQKLNVLSVLSHGDVINLPIYIESACISINTASLDELGQIPGVGPKTAESIFNHREQNGLFQTLEDMMQIKGIGQKKFDKMLGTICL